MGLILGVTAAADKKFSNYFSFMDIESELPDNFDELSNDKKVEELEELKGRLDDNSDSGAIKKRIIEELIRKYS